MRISFDTGDCGLKRQVREAKASNRILQQKLTTLTRSIDTLKKELDGRAELNNLLGHYNEENKELVEVIKRHETTVSDLVKQAA